MSFTILVVGLAGAGPVSAQLSGPGRQAVAPRAGARGIQPFTGLESPDPSQTRLPQRFEILSRPDGPLFELHPTLAVSEQYTDNFRLSRDNREDNWRSTIAPGLNAELNLPRTQGALTARLAVSHDTARDDDSIRFFPTLTLSLKHVFSPRLSVTVADHLRRGDDPLEAEGDGLRLRRDTFLANTLVTTVDWLIDVFETQYYYRLSTFFSDRDTISHILGTNATIPLTALDSLRLGYEFTLRDSEGTARGSRDETGHRLFGKLAHRLGEFTSVGLNGTASLQMSDRRDSQIYNLSVFGSHALPTGFFGAASLGGSIINVEGRKDVRGTFSSSATAGYHGARTTLSLTYFQDFRQTADEGQDFGIVLTQRVRGDVMYEITPFISASLRASYSRNDPVVAGPEDLAREVVVVDAGLAWQIVRWLRMTLDYAHVERWTDSRQGDTSENRATLTLLATF